MRTLPKTVALLAVAVGGLGAVAHAQPAPAAGRPGLVCLSTSRILRTRVPDDRTIVFTMRDGKVWKNTLKGRCPNLRTYGFGYVSPDAELCSNSQTIEVLRTGAVCGLGEFTPLERRPKGPQER